MTVNFIIPLRFNPHSRKIFFHFVEVSNIAKGCYKLSYRLSRLRVLTSMLLMNLCGHKLIFRFSNTGYNWPYFGL